MNEPIGIAFAPAIGTLDGKPMICFISAKCPGDTNIFWLTAENARKLAIQLNGMADFLDPPKKEWQVAPTTDGKLVASLQEKASDVLKHAEAAAAILQKARKRTRKTRGPR